MQANACQFVFDPARMEVEVERDELVRLGAERVLALAAQEPAGDRLEVPLAGELGDIRATWRDDAGDLGEGARYGHQVMQHAHGDDLFGRAGAERQRVR